MEDKRLFKNKKVVIVKFELVLNKYNIIFKVIHLNIYR